MLRFNLDIDIIADKWETPAQKKDFIDNFTEIVQTGLEKMTVPDWTVKNVSVKELDNEGVDNVINKEFRIYQDEDELRILDQYGYTFISIANPDNNNKGAFEVAEQILKTIDLKEMLK